MAVICRLPQGGSGGAVEEQLVNYAMLYDLADECTGITGGWSSDNFTGLTANGTTWTRNGTTTKESNRLAVKVSNSAHSAGFMTVNPIDVTEYSNLYYELTNSSVGSYHAYAYSEQSGGNAFFANWLKYCGENTTEVANASYTAVVDISDLKSIHIVAGVVQDTNYNYFNRIYITKEDNWQEWLIKGGLNPAGYTSVDDIMANKNALITLMNSKEAVDYMLLKCTGTVMASVIQSGNALKAIRESQYNAEIFANEHWCKFLEMVGESLESNKTYLYNKGDECTSITGGWNVNLNNAPTKTASYMYFTSSSWSGVRTANNVDVSKAKKLVVEWSKHGSLGENADMQIAICKPNNFTIWSDFDANRLAYFAYGHKTVYTYANGSYKAEVDISGYVASYPSVKVVVSMYTGSANFRFDKVWIE